MYVPANTTNINSAGSEMFASLIDKAFLKQLEPTRVFEQFTARKIAQNGFKSVTFLKMQKSELTSSQATLLP